MEIVRRQLCHPHDGLLTVLLDGVGLHLLLRLPDQGLLQAADHLALGMDVLGRRQEETVEANGEGKTENGLGK